MKKRPFWRLLASRNTRELAAIACTVFVIPAVALAGLTLSLFPNGVGAPILEAPRALFGGARDTTSGLVRLVAGPESEAP